MSDCFINGMHDSHLFFLQAAEDFLVQLMEDAMLCAIHAKRVTLSECYFQLKLFGCYLTCAGTIFFYITKKFGWNLCLQNSTLKLKCWTNGITYILCMKNCRKSKQVVYQFGAILRSLLHLFPPNETKQLHNNRSLLLT